MTTVAGGLGAAKVRRHPVLATIRPTEDSEHRTLDDRLARVHRPRWAKSGAVLAVAIVLLSCGLFHVWVRLQVTGLGYDLSTIRDIVARLEHEQRELEAELAMLTAPKQLAEEARRRLQMREPTAGEVVIIR